MLESGNKDENKKQAAGLQGPQLPQNADSERQGGRQLAGTQPNKSFWEALKELLIRKDSPLPLRIVGIVLNRLPASWEKPVLVTVLIVVLIGIIYSVGQPIGHVCDSIYCWFAPGPPVQVTLWNETGKDVTIDKSFEYWLLASREDNRDPGLARRGLGELPTGSTTIPPGEPNKVTLRLRLGKGLSIRRIYRGGAWFRLRFNQSEALEAEELWGKAISDGAEFIVRIYDLDDWTSSPIDIRFSEMKGKDPTKKIATEKVYLPNDSSTAMRMTKEKFDVFETFVGDRDPNQITADIKVGCYPIKDGENAIDIQIVDNDYVVHEFSDIHTYDNTRPIEEVLSADEFANKIRREIFAIYPLQGIICYVDSKEYQPKERPAHKLRKIQLNIGRLAGVRINDIFETLPSSNRGYLAGFELKIISVTAKTSTAFLRWEEKVEEGWCVRWKKAGL